MKIAFGKIATVALGIILGALVLFFDCLLYLQYQSKQVSTSSLVFQAILMNLTLIFVVCIPYFQKKMDANREASLMSFLQMPNREDSLTFPALTTFLGEQALGAFLGTSLMYVIKNVYPQIGAALTAILTFVLLMISLTIIVFSLVRFVMYFTKHSMWVYMFMALVSLSLSLSFFYLGVQFG
ncbi:hypothetical protein [Pseudomonas frederiksbergensis]|uniref:Uncharacterized protein n=1 Tax=Pseudomonas frederiksbergensis TaxID=104087 RepID=A0A6L5C3U8_9PSED|nr:hypothetical protein [Pseudomonas frederiksbergensis]KAF2394214.1 hypothetical protein FX983_02195 [Pseudomonas frederiksbergensis]